MKVKVKDIVWDTDEDDVDAYQLPEEMVVEVDSEDEAIDACSDETGWCISTASIEVMP